jgi:hypothetical protein
VDELSKLNFEQDLAEVLDIVQGQRWKVERLGPLEVIVAVSPEKSPQEVFYARLLWQIYPGDPPSLKFRDPSTGSLTLRTAWPEVRGFRPQSLDACVNYCAEGFALHPEWKNDPNLKWNSSGNALLCVIKKLQNELDRYFVRRSE